MPAPAQAPIPATRPPDPSSLRWLDGLCLALFLLALLRGVMMLTASPLVALANNYDQVRYSACLDLYPLRPGVDPGAQSYQTPLKTYAFQSVPGAGCYWTSDLLFQGATAGLYHLRQKLGGDNAHSVRILGGLRLIAWLVAGAWLCLAFRREGQAALAVANAAWLAVLAFDPVNSIYLNTLYAEAGALFFAYLTVAVGVLTALRVTPWRWALLAAAALLLGTAKIQHMALPLCLAAALALSAVIRIRSLWPLVLALGLGGSAALAIQILQQHRDVAMFGQIARVNTTNFVLTALLPASNDPPRTAQALGLDASCAQHAGKSAYTLEVPIEQACAGMARTSRVRALALLLSEPRTLLVMLRDTPAKLLPWIPRYLGLVARTELAPLPSHFVSVDRLLGERTALAWLALLAPTLGWLYLIVRRPAQAAAVAFAGMTCAIALSVPIVSIFGDGLAELAKHAHLALSAGFAFLVAASCTALLQPMIRRLA